MEFLSDEELFCGQRCYAYTVVDRPDEIFVSRIQKRFLLGIREGRVKGYRSPRIYALHLKTGTMSVMSLEPFLELDIVFEDLPVRRHDDFPGLKYAANTEGHQYVAPIHKMGRDYVAALSSARETDEKTTVGVPGIIPFFGRSKWVQKEKSHSGTFFLEVFDKGHPSKPIVQLQKGFKDMWLLPSVFEVATWVQGKEHPILVVVDRENPKRTKKGRILLIRPN